MLNAPVPAARKALAKANQKLLPGDAVVIRTGWSKLMGKENQRYGSVNPGIGIAAASGSLDKIP
jgi:kynurenine formamidase